MYRGKRTDLEHRHYICKTNMAVCHKVRETRFRQVQVYRGGYTCTESQTGVEVVVSPEHGCIHPSYSSSEYSSRPAEMGKEQTAEIKYRLHPCKVNSTNGLFTCPYNIVQLSRYINTSFCFLNRNQQKRAKKVRHEQEKAFMEQLHGAGYAVGEYVGGGRGDIEEEMEGIDEEDAVHEERCNLVNGHLAEEEEEEDSIENAHPLLFFFDTETTGLNIYSSWCTFSKTHTALFLKSNPHTKEYSFQRYNYTCLE